MIKWNEPCRNDGELLKITQLERIALGIVLILISHQSRLLGFTKEEERDIRETASNFNYSTVTTKEGLRYRVPEDMPIETKNGIQAPVPFDEYMYSKFKSIDVRLKSIEFKIDRMDKTLSTLAQEKSDTLSSGPN